MNRTFWHSEAHTLHNIRDESIPCRTNSLTDWLFLTKKRNIHFPSYPTHHHVSQYNIIFFLLVLSYCLEWRYFSRCTRGKKRFPCDYIESGQGLQDIYRKSCVKFDWGSLIRTQYYQSTEILVYLLEDLGVIHLGNILSKARSFPWEVMEWG